MNEILELTAFSAFVAAAIQRGTPLALAAMGEGISERSGVINLGVEGMMLAGALAGFVAQQHGYGLICAFMAAALAGAALASLHGLLVLGCGANQLVSGFAITILGTGLTGFFGRSSVGVTVAGVPPMPLEPLARIPLFGKALFGQDMVVYLTMLTAVLLTLLLSRTSFGLRLRAVGEDPAAAFALGVPVLRTRFIAILSGGVLSGVGGAYLALANTHVWSEKMTSGTGWVAVGLVIVARWQPLAIVILAWVFGSLLVLHPYLQGTAYEISPYLVAMLPYLATILALIAVTVLLRRSGSGVPAALSGRFDADR